MIIPQPSSSARGSVPRRLVGFLALAAILGGVSVAALQSNPRVFAADPPSASAKAKETLVGGLPLFAKWPKNRRPDAAIVFTGQTYGYLQPCGCSRPQIGGLERRAVFIQSLKNKGWPVVGVDLGDVAPEKSVLREQAQLKYVAVMNSLREMGYLGVGIGKTELKSDLIGLLAQYGFQKEQRPFSLAGNLAGVRNGQIVPRGKTFDAGRPGARPIVELMEVAKAGAVPVGVVGVIGKSVAKEARKEKWDPTFEFQDVKLTLKAATAALANHPLHPQLNVLIYQGDSTCAAKIASDFPQFQVVLCLAEDGAPAPLQPLKVPDSKTLIVQVGHRGQHVGVLGAFKNPAGGFEFKYQLVPLGEEYITPGTEAEAHKNNKVLQILEEYAKAVKDANFLPEYPRVPHPAQIQAAGLTPPMKLSYVGTQNCTGCHAAEFARWKQVPHSHAMNTLEHVAKRPSLRQFDGECVKCHTVGFAYQTGYVNEKKTPLLRDVGCENCHGPGSGHVAQPKNKALLAYMSPWKQAGAAKLPDAAFMKKMADTPDFERGRIPIAPAQQILIRGVEGTCMKCHDSEADPHFDLYKNWPKIDHSGLAPKGGWPVVPPKPSAQPKQVPNN